VSGYIGFKTMILALEAGYDVRAVIRNEAQGGLLTTHPRVNAYKDRLEIAIVPNMAQEGAFDDHLEGVNAILHLASPLAIEVSVSAIADPSSNN
jgi:nucleoside-diphosphate-sugar epimerase